MARRFSVTVVVGSIVHAAGSEVPPGVEVDASLIETDEVPEAPSGQPAGNASTEVWAEYARTLGATDADLVDSEGQALGRDALRDKYGK